jgi:transposase
VFVQATKSKRAGKTYFTYLVRESFRTAEGPRSRTICNISKLPPKVRELVSNALAGKRLVAEEAIELHHALDCGGLAVLVEAWQQLGIDQLLADIGTPRDRALLKAMVFSRLLFPCAKLALKERAAGSLLAAACGLDAGELFHEDDLYAAMDALTGHWCALEKGLGNEAFPNSVSLVLYDLTSVYFEGEGPVKIGRYGHSRDHRADRRQILLAVATDTRGVPLHISVLRGNRADTTTLQGLLNILRRRFGIREAVFVFDGGMSSKLNLEALEASELKFVTRLSNATLEALLSVLPEDRQLELADADKLVEVEHAGKRHVIAGGPWRRQRDQERRAMRIAKAEAALSKIAGVKRRKPDAQKIASQAGRTLQKLKAHKYFSYRVDATGILRWERKEQAIAAESAHDGWYLLHTNLLEAEAKSAQIQGHYKNLLEVEEAFCELKSYLRVRPVFHYRPDRVVNHVRICFLAYWISARLATQWRARGEHGEVTRILRQLQTIRLAQIQVGKAAEQTLSRFTQVPQDLNALLEKLNLLHLFATPPKWALSQPL